jgi:hypothetical protein
MKKIILLMAFALVFSAMETTAQTEKFDIATFTPPAGWQRLDSNNVLIFHNYRTVGNGTVFCQIILFPSKTGSSNAAKNFTDEWNNLVAKTTSSSTKPVTETEKTPDGWTVVKGYGNVTQQGVTYTCILATVSGFGKMMSVMVNLAGQDFLQDVESFLQSFELDSKAAVAKSATTPPNAAANFDWSNYSFIPPQGWQMLRTNQYIMLSQSQTPEHGCIVSIFPPMQSSGNLETDARNLFGQMYPGWSYRFTGEKHDDISKGYTLQGLEYCMIEAPMHKQRPDGYYYDYEDGAIWVIGMGKQIVVVTGRHNRNIACFCFHQYEYWRRFFNSFTVKGQAAAKGAQEDLAKRVVGDWMAIGSTALTEYIFAANGNYQFIGAFGTSTKTSDAYFDYIHTQTSSFTGDGSYSIKNNQLVLKRRGDKATEQMPCRFETVNHGGTGWKDRLYLRKISEVDGKEYEVCYEKRK